MSENYLVGGQRMSQEVYDFAGWATKSDIVCADGRVIKRDAFKNNDATTVPLVFEHGWRDPKNIIGRVKLENRDTGVYAFGYFNDTANGQHAKTSVKHGDIVAMSIGAHKIQQSGTDVVHGEIFEISLVGKGANPGALIEEVISHSDNGDVVDTGQIVVYSDNIIHSIDSVVEPVQFKPKGETITMAEKTIGEVLKTLDEEQTQAVEALIGSILEEEENDNDEGDDNVKHNAFDKSGDNTLFHNVTEVQSDIKHAIDTQSGSLKGIMVSHGIENMELLFPEAKNLNEVPYVYSDINTASDAIIAGITKSPWAKIRSTWADFTAEEARAQGYMTGDQKIEQIFTLAKRQTSPQTIYKLQKMDRDNILDMKRTLDIVPFLNREMRMMLNQEMAKAALVGDGRPYLVSGEPNRQKISEENIRPIRSDDDFYTIKKTYTDASTFVESVIKSYGEYRGSGRPTLFINPDVLADIQLLKGTDGRWLNMTGIPSLTELAAQLRVKEIVETSFLGYGEAIIVNLTDYQFGTDRGGEIATFDDFNIDFNRYTYLIETRLSGALVRPKSAIYLTQGEITPVTSIVPNKTAVTLEVGAQEQITVSFVPTGATNKNLSWASLDHTVATVSAGGQITARGEGETSIKVVSPENGINATITVTVTAAE